jgi:hypothetical protein
MLMLLIRFTVTNKVDKDAAGCLLQTYRHIHTYSILVKTRCSWWKNVSACSMSAPRSSANRRALTMAAATLARFSGLSGASSSTRLCLLYFPRPSAFLASGAGAGWRLGAWPCPEGRGNG